MVCRALWEVVGGKEPPGVREARGESDAKLATAVFPEVEDQYTGSLFEDPGFLYQLAVRTRCRRGSRRRSAPWSVLGELED